MSVQRFFMSRLLKMTVGEMTDYGLPEARPQAARGAPDGLLGAAAADRPRRHRGQAEHRPLRRRPHGPFRRRQRGGDRPRRLLHRLQDRRSPSSPETVFAADDNRMPLYKRVVSVENPGLYFIGFIQPLGPIMPIAEAQSEWIADLLTDKAALPPAGGDARGDRGLRTVDGEALRLLQAPHDRGGLPPLSARDSPRAQAFGADGCRAPPAVLGPLPPEPPAGLGMRAPAADAVAGSVAAGRPSIGSGALLAHQISQSAPSTGIFSTTSRKKIGRNPSIAQCRGLRVAQMPWPRPSAPRPGPPRGRGGTRWGRAGSAPRVPAPTRSSSRRSCRRSRPPAGPLPYASSGPSFQWAEPKRAAPSKLRYGQLRQPEDVRQVVVRFVLPPGRPDQVVDAPPAASTDPPATSEMQCTIPSTSSNFASDLSGGSSNPNREMTPSTSTARIGLLISNLKSRAGVAGKDQGVR